MCEGGKEWMSSSDTVVRRGNRGNTIYGWMGGSMGKGVVICLYDGKKGN